MYTIIVKGKSDNREIVTVITTKTPQDNELPEGFDGLTYKNISSTIKQLKKIDPDWESKFKFEKLDCHHAR